MQIERMKFIDQKVGHVLCLFLDIYEKLKGLFRKLLGLPEINNTSELDTKQILITKYFGMGSILLATPMLNALKSKYPEAKIIFLTFTSNYDFLKLLNVADEVLTLRTDSFFSFTKDLIVRLVYLRKKHIDIAIDLEFFSKFSTLVVYMTGAKIRAGFYLRSMWRGDLLTHHIYYNHYKHITEIFFNFAQVLGASTGDIKINKIAVPEGGRKALASSLATHNVAGNCPLVSVNVNASEMAYERRWPAENFVYLIENIAAKFPQISFILTGSPKEKAYVHQIFEKIHNQNDNIINLAGELQLEAMLALLERSILFITNDSGPLHMAAALGTPTISFFGPETPKLYGAIGENHLTFYKGPYCSPCLSVYNAKSPTCEGDNICVKSITPREVQMKVEEKLNSYVAKH